MSWGQIAALAGLGAFHGLNPAMGWLFAVARGMQERSRWALLRSLPPIAAGHLASVAIVAAVVSATRSVVAANVVGIGSVASTGSSISPAPCALDTRNDQPASWARDSRMPAHRKCRSDSSRQRPNPTSRIPPAIPTTFAATTERVADTTAATIATDAR